MFQQESSMEDCGTYSLRKGGCERFDSRSAKELLVYLLDLLDDESHAFLPFPVQNYKRWLVRWSN